MLTQSPRRRPTLVASEDHSWGSLGTQRLGVQVNPEERTSFFDKFLGQSGHVADRETDGIHERALLDPPAKSFCKTFLAFRIKRARRAQFFDGSENVKRIAVKLRPDLKDRSSPIASCHRGELGARRPYRNLD